MKVESKVARSLLGISVGVLSMLAFERPASADVRKDEFVPASERADRAIELSLPVSASVEEVWQAWTTSEGVASFSAPKSRIELRPGGAYEWHFFPDAPEGSRGGEGCRVLALDPPHRLVFSWNAPPSIAGLRASGAKTTVFLDLEPFGGGTRVTLRQVGLGSGAEWDAYHNYFSSAWKHVLTGLRDHFAKAAGSDAKRQKQYVYFISPARKTFETDATAEENRIVGEHFRYLQGLLKEGRLVMAGRTQTSEPTGIVVFEAADDAAAEAVFRGDPAVKAGVFVGEVKPYGVALIR